MVNAVVMILRVWVMYNRSRLILGILLMLFFVEIVSTVIAAVIGSYPQNVSGM
jgi:diacylglycerol kinase